ncbi:uncharacterized protein LOC119689397 [Teleopsis dalmanni]|uniref:uncharacterized protein LOC119689397 n=1 Tax=Teleopsis dalmanni TaxID=139649 RepID=UPI0018CD8EF0|nr:uncharacterized protein LOC119689397 [Teleopsis dalmanni]
MSRRKPIHMLDVVGNLDSNIITAIPEYIVSKESDKKNNIKPPNEDAFVETPQTFYLSCLREFNTLVEAQNAQMEENRRYDIMNAHHNAEICADQRLLREKFIKCTSKLKELRQKEETTRLIIEEHALEQKLMKDKSEEHRVSIKTLKIFRTEFQQTLQRYVLYENFMKDFLKDHPKYGTSEQFINSMDALMLANVDINSMNEQLVQSISDMKSELVTITRDIANSILSMKNELDFFQRAFVKVCHEVADMEENLSKIRTAWIKRQNEKNRMGEGLYNLYSLLCRRRNKYTDLRTTEIEKICEFVKHEYDVLHFTTSHIEEPCE